VEEYHNIDEHLTTEFIIAKVEIDEEKILEIVRKELRKFGVKYRAIDVYIDKKWYAPAYVDLVIAVELRVLSNSVVEWIKIMNAILEAYEKMGFSKESIQLDVESVIRDFEENMPAIGFKVGL